MINDVLIIAHYCSDFDSVGNIRFNYLADLLAKEYSNVELVTSDFSHFKKTKREKPEGSYSFKITLIPEPKYSKNISIKRFYSHHIMGRNLAKYLEGRVKPDLIYCAVPSLDIAQAASDYAIKNNIRFIIDIQDLWPEAFKMLFNVKFVSDILFYKMKRKADKIYMSADEIIAVSQTFADRALAVSEKCSVGHSIFLGTDLNAFDKMAEENTLPNMRSKDEVWLSYIGTLGHSYDITSVIDALKILKNKGFENIKFVVMGDGPLKPKFEKYAKDQGIYAEFTGRLDYNKMAGMLCSCDIAVNPIKAGSAGSIINKVCDYAAAGLPVLNTQECQEYRDLVDEYDMGFNCNNNDAADLAEKLLRLCEDKTLRKTMGQNSRRLATERFDRKRTYNEIPEIINNLK